MSNEQRYREALESIAEYWNGSPDSAVDAAEEMRFRAEEALSEPTATITEPEKWQPGTTVIVDADLPSEVLEILDDNSLGCDCGTDEPGTCAYCRLQRYERDGGINPAEVVPPITACPCGKPKDHVIHDTSEPVTHAQAHEFGAPQPAKSAEGERCAE